MREAAAAPAADEADARSARSLSRSESDRQTAGRTRPPPPPPSPVASGRGCENEGGRIEGRKVHSLAKVQFTWRAPKELKERWK